jgi:hypothetical protein
MCQNNYIFVNKSDTIRGSPHTVYIEQLMAVRFFANKSGLLKRQLIIINYNKLLIHSQIR